eukprot:COSAG05_NODE_1229_length_5448_cov_26.241167_5_plen_114_part_00
MWLGHRAVLGDATAAAAADVDATAAANNVDPNTSTVPTLPIVSPAGARLDPPPPSLHIPVISVAGAITGAHDVQSTMCAGVRAMSTADTTGTAAVPGRLLVSYPPRAPAPAPA